MHGIVYIVLVDFDEELLKDYFGCEWRHIHDVLWYMKSPGSHGSDCSNRSTITHHPKTRCCVECVKRLVGALSCEIPTHTPIHRNWYKTIVLISQYFSAGGVDVLSRLLSCAKLAIGNLILHGALRASLIDMFLLRAHLLTSAREVFGEVDDSLKKFENMFSSVDKFKKHLNYHRSFPSFLSTLYQRLEGGFLEKRSRTDSTGVAEELVTDTAPAISARNRREMLQAECPKFLLNQRASGLQSHALSMAEK